LLPDKCFTDPRITVAKQNGGITSALAFPSSAAPSPEFLGLHEPFPDIVDTALTDISMP